MNLIALLNETKNSTQKYYGLPPTELNKSYGPGKWSVKQILVHLADAEAALNERIKRVIAGPKQVICAFNQDLFCSSLEYEMCPIQLSKSLYRANRESIIFLATKFYEVLGAKPFVHSETGRRTLKDEFEKVVSHTKNHLKQIEDALA